MRRHSSSPSIPGINQSLIKAAFTDGRYTLQLAAQTDPALFELQHITEQPAPAWIVAHTKPGARIGYDPWLLSEDALARYRKKPKKVVKVLFRHGF